MATISKAARTRKKQTVKSSPYNPFVIGDKVKVLYHDQVFTVVKVEPSLFGTIIKINPHPENDSCYQYEDALTLADVQL